MKKVNSKGIKWKDIPQGNQCDCERLGEENIQLRKHVRELQSEMMRISEWSLRFGDE